MNDATLQADEFEALTSIYGNELVFDSPDRKTFSIDLRLSSDETTQKQVGHHDRHIKLQVALPIAYPTTSPPSYTISAPWMCRSKKAQLTNALQQVYAENAGESILYMCIEKAREFLTEGLASMPYQDSDDEEVEIVDFAFRKNISEQVNVDDVHIYHGEPVTDRRSTFQAHLAIVSDVSQAKRMIDQVKENKKLATATHNISAYRIAGGPHGTCLQDCDDDGESHAGGRLLHLMQVLDVKDVVVVVSRWFGGIQLGADRFKLINSVARDLLLKCSVLPSNEAAHSKDACRKKKGK